MTASENERPPVFDMKAPEDDDMISDTWADMSELITQPESDSVSQRASFLHDVKRSSSNGVIQLNSDSYGSEFEPTEIINESDVDCDLSHIDAHLLAADGSDMSQSALHADAFPLPCSTASVDSGLPRVGTELCTDPFTATASHRRHSAAATSAPSATTAHPDDDSHCGGTVQKSPVIVIAPEDSSATASYDWATTLCELKVQRQILCDLVRYARLRGVHELEAQRFKVEALLRRLKTQAPSAVRWSAMREKQQRLLVTKSHAALYRCCLAEAKLREKKNATLPRLKSAKAKRTSGTRDVAKTAHFEQQLKQLKMQIQRQQAQLGHIAAKRHSLVRVPPIVNGYAALWKRTCRVLHNLDLEMEYRKSKIKQLQSRIQQMESNVLNVGRLTSQEISVVVAGSVHKLPNDSQCRCVVIRLRRQEAELHNLELEEFLDTQNINCQQRALKRKNILDQIARLELELRNMAEACRGGQPKPPDVTAASQEAQPELPDVIAACREGQPVLSEVTASQEAQPEMHDVTAAPREAQSDHSKSPHLYNGATTTVATDCFCKSLRRSLHVDHSSYTVQDCFGYCNNPARRRYVSENYVIPSKPPAVRLDKQRHRLFDHHGNAKLVKTHKNNKRSHYDIDADDDVTREHVVIAQKPPAKKVRRVIDFEELKVRKLERPQEMKVTHCEFCWERFTDVNEVNQHKVQVHSDAKGCFKCIHCGVVFLFPARFFAHMDKFHSEMGVKPCGRCGPNPVSGEQRTRCRQCVGKKIRVAIKSDDQCDICFMTLPNEDDLRAHMTSHKVFADIFRICAKCPKRIHHGQHFVVHWQQKHGAAPLQCPYCPQRWTNQNQADREFFLHVLNDFKFWKCDLCDAKYVKRKHLCAHRHGHVELSMPVSLSPAANQCDHTYTCTQSKSKLAVLIFYVFLALGGPCRRGARLGY